MLATTTHRARLASRDLTRLLRLLLLLLLGLLGLGLLGSCRRRAILALGRGSSVDSGLSRLLRLGALLLLRLGGFGFGAVGGRGGGIRGRRLGRLTLGLFVLVTGNASTRALLPVSVSREISPRLGCSREMLAGREKGR